MFKSLARWQHGKSVSGVTLAVLALLVCGGGLPGCSRGPRGLPSDAVMAGKVVADGAQYYGRQIKVYGYVSNSSGPGVFAIADGVGGTASLPVVVKSDGFAVTMGEQVLVEGTATAFDSGRVKQDYGVDLPGETSRGWQNRPVLIAVKMRKLD